MRLGIFIPTPFRNYDRVQSALWIRALQMVDCMRADGIDVSVNNPLRTYDAAIYHRGVSRNSVRFVYFLRRIAERVYWDTCVDYFETHEAASSEQVACSRTIAALVDGVCVPTEGIAASARRYSGNVFVMPDPVNLGHLGGYKDFVDYASPTFGWSGVACKAGFLNRYAGFLDDRTVIVSEKRPDLSFRYRFIPWTYGGFPSALRTCDIAFLPRTLDSTYTANNSSFKALVYATQGIPIVANRLPSYELMSADYEAMAFLEDFGDSPQDAVDALVERDRDPARLRRAYDRRLWARHLARWLQGE